ncbi:MAG: thiol peroxidase [Anaerolineae bacterium]|nr:thiol peroxidase [Anaerolineae bacterium]
MTERTGLVTLKGAPRTLIGNAVTVGDQAPDFTVLDNTFKPVRFSELPGKVYVISAVPSLDTSVCDAETRRFNQEAAKLGDDVAILTISMDLPYAQKRWCGATGVDRVTTLSDFKDREFGQAYGVITQESGLLARAVFVVDKTGRISYIQLVPEIAAEPDYNAVLQAVEAARQK